MSGKVSGQVWDLDLRAVVEAARADGKIDADARIEPQPLRTLLLALADHADHNGRNVYPGVDLLVWKTELSERRVRALLSLLRRLGILVPVRYLAGGRGHATEYRLDFREAPRKPTPTEKHDAEDSVLENPVADDSLCEEPPESLQSGSESLPADAQRVQPETERVQSRRLKPDVTGPPTGLTVITGEPSDETSGEPSRAARAREGFSKKDDDVSSIWTAIGLRLAITVPEEMFKTYLAGSRAVSFDGEHLVLEPANPFHVPYLVGPALGPKIAAAAAAELGDQVHVEWQSAPPAPPPKRQRPPPVLAAGASR